MSSSTLHWRLLVTVNFVMQLLEISGNHEPVLVLEHCVLGLVVVQQKQPRRQLLMDHFVNVILPSLLVDLHPQLVRLLKVDLLLVVFERVLGHEDVWFFASTA